MTLPLPPDTTNNTSEWWSITDLDGSEVSLHQFNWSVKSFGSSRYALPSLKGDTQAFAYSPGAELHNRYAEPRTISLAMWMTGTKADGSFTNNQILQFNDNLNKLRRLVWRPFGSQFTLTRRWLLTDPVTGNATIQKAEAQAALAGPMDPENTGRTRIDFSLDLLLADPYFYLDWVTAEVPYNTPTIVYNPGDDYVMWKYFTITMHGPTVASNTALISPRLTNTTPTPNVWFRFERSIPDQPHNLPERNVVFDIEDYKVIPWYLPISFVKHSGSRRWFALAPGNNSVTLTSDGTIPIAGSATFRFRPPVV